MKVYDLGCGHDHRFEGWFGSAEEFESQRDRGLIECPLCGSHEVRRLPSAARLNLARASDGRPAQDRDQPAPAAGEAPPTGAGAPPEGGAVQALQAAWLRLARRVIANTEDVGDRFTDEARRIHRDEAPARPIRGVATARQAAELADEGIEVVALPLPAAAKEPLQ